MTYQTRSQLNPEGGEEMAQRPTTYTLDPIPVPYGRDVQTDARRMGEVDGSGGNIMDDRDLDDVGYLSDMNSSSLGTEKRRNGWIRLATPVGGIPAPATTAGTRGARDIGPLPDDGSLP